MATMKPYADDTASLSIGELTLENGRDCLSLYGTLNLTRDKAGLAQARALQSVLNEVVQALESDPKLPDAVTAAKAPRQVKNPFG